MMTAAVKGHTVVNAIALTDRFQGQLTGQDRSADQGLGRLEALRGVARYPNARQVCDACVARAPLGTPERQGRHRSGGRCVGSLRRQ